MQGKTNDCREVPGQCQEKVLIANLDGVCLLKMQLFLLFQKLREGEPGWPPLALISDPLI